MTAEWTRSADGMVAGVCDGLAKRFKVDVLLVRLALIFSVLAYGVGICFYIVLAIALPRQDRLEAAYENKILGVCKRFAIRFDLDIGLTRAGFLFLLFASLGMVFFAYIILHFLMPKQNESRL